jgi:translation elongation factor EF-1alpha
MSDTTLKPVIIRTFSAGVHFGYLFRRDGKEVELHKSRRIWRWYGANTLSEIALHGLDEKTSRVAEPVTITLTEVIEIIDCTPEAVAKIEAAKWAK